MGLFRRKKKPIEEKETWDDNLQVERDSYFPNSGSMNNNDMKLILSKLDLIESKINEYPFTYF